MQPSPPLKKYFYFIFNLCPVFPSKRAAVFRASNVEPFLARTANKFPRNIVIQSKGTASFKVF